ncbi:monocarboxylate transporter 3-like [Penaeus japonicus]|uniref:monocarboxylate transporter 3-like n=1 Tax=Penaeus japonicus TaxID=27405 RepID=UPI001C713B7C|nr:monocarboxylate transporter 3-like [Penaeus japonicus]
MTEDSPKPAFTAVEEDEGTTLPRLAALQEEGGDALPTFSTLEEMEGATLPMFAGLKEDGSATPATPAAPEEGAEGSVSLVAPAAPEEGAVAPPTSTTLDERGGAPQSMLKGLKEDGSTTEMENDAAPTAFVVLKDERSALPSPLAAPKEVRSAALPKEEGGAALPKEEGGAALPKEEGGTPLEEKDRDAPPTFPAVEKEGGAASPTQAAPPLATPLHPTVNVIQRTGDTNPSPAELESPSEEGRAARDGGWGWCIVGSGFITLLILSGISLSTATLLGAQLTELEAPAALGTWIFNVQSAVWCFAGLWAEPLGLRFSHRVVGAVAAVVCSIAIMASAPITNPYLFFLTISVMYGAGGGICVTCCFQMTRRYFNRRLGMANGAMLCGGTLGVAIMATLVETLQYNFDFFFATLIFGALPLIPAATSLTTFIPIEPYWENPTPSTDCVLQAALVGGTTFPGAVFAMRRGEKEEKERVIREHFRENFRFSELKEPHVISCALVTSITQVVMLNIYTVASYVLREAGYSSLQLMTFLWVAEAFDLASRLCCCLHCDRPMIPISLLYMIGQILFLIMTLVLTFQQSWTSVLICASGFGICLGIMFVLDLLLMISIIGNENFQSVFGVSMVMRSCAFLLIGPIGGLIREVSQDYGPTFLFLSSVLAFSISIPCISAVYRTHILSMNAET